MAGFNNDSVDQVNLHNMTHFNPSTEAAGHPFMRSQGADARTPSSVAMDILRRTALNWASTPGGLRLTAGQRVWLQDLSATTESDGLSWAHCQTGKNP